MNKELKNKILDTLEKRGYEDVTINSYSKKLEDLFNFYPGIDPLKITNKQVTKYAIALRRRDLSPSTIRSLIYACDFFFKEMNGIDHGNYAVKLPVKREKEIEFFTQEEILNLIEHKTNIKHKAIITLMYACGLKPPDIVNLEISHVRSKFNPPILQVYNKKNKFKRKVKLPRKIIPLITEYYIEHKPIKWFFYSGKDKEKQYGTTSIGKIINDSVKKLGYNQELNSKSIYYSYIKHLTDLGVPLINILRNFGITGYSTYEEYSKLIFGTKEVEISPIEKKINEYAQIEEFDELEQLIFKVQTEIEANYLLEGVQCFRIGALRAGVIFIWSAAIRKVHELLIQKFTLNQINNELPNTFKKKIKSAETFQQIKDEDVLHMAGRLELFDKQEKNELINVCLGLRNKCSHPTNFKPKIHRVNSFVENIIEIIYKNHDT